MVELIRLITDFGLLVLIWIVQLVIYPSFQYYQSQDLHNWHRQYTSRITTVVLPLMFTQLVVTVLQILTEITLYSGISMLIVLALWLLTFLVFVPLHQKIEHQTYETKSLSKLVKFNWLRTGLWSILFLISLFHVVNK